MKYLLSIALMSPLVAQAAAECRMNDGLRSSWIYGPQALLKIVDNGVVRTPYFNNWASNAAGSLEVVKAYNENPASAPPGTQSFFNTLSAISRYEKALGKYRTCVFTKIDDLKAQIKTIERFKADVNKADQESKSEAEAIHAMSRAAAFGKIKHHDYIWNCGFVARQMPKTEEEVQKWYVCAGNYLTRLEKYEAQIQSEIDAMIDNYRKTAFRIRSVQVENPVNTAGPDSGTEKATVTGPVDDEASVESTESAPQQTSPPIIVDRYEAGSGVRELSKPRLLQEYMNRE